MVLCAEMKTKDTKVYEENKPLKDLKRITIEGPG